jgi:hypothetical protein
MDRRRSGTRWIQGDREVRRHNQRKRNSQVTFLYDAPPDCATHAACSLPRLALVRHRRSRSFKGRRLHSENWDDSVSFDNKRVGLIGGSSAIQILPELQPVVQHVTTFIRTKTWVALLFTSEKSSSKPARFPGAIRSASWSSAKLPILPTARNNVAASEKIPNICVNTEGDRAREQCAFRSHDVQGQPGRQ